MKITRDAVSNNLVFELSRVEWETLRDTVADVSCWHKGFNAASKDHEPPPGLNDLIDAVSDMKRNVIDAKIAGPSPFIDIKKQTINGLRHEFEKRVDTHEFFENWAETSRTRMMAFINDVLNKAE